MGVDEAARISQIPEGEIQKREELPGAMMPANLDRVRSAAYFAALVAYLASSKP